MVEQAQKKQQYKKIDKKRFKAAPLGRMTVVKHLLNLDHQDNTLQRSLKSFQPNYCISLRNSGIYKQTYRQTTWLSSSDWSWKYVD